ncbi:MAG: tyrosine protein phosphatase [Hyphomicrobiales bacterium]|nr:tyrosine protein phosphatase [Hyphomicrobiales bacterium]
MSGLMIHVSSLSGLPQLASSLQRFDLLTLLSPSAEARDWSGIARERHVRLSFHDIVELTPDLIAPDADVMRAILDFGRGAFDDRPLLIHCWAGISRSSAAAYAIACDRNPGREADIADELRRRSPYVTPNKLMVRLADEMLGRDGRMSAAIARIGRGAETAEGEPYQLPLRWPI